MSSSQFVVLVSSSRLTRAGLACSALLGLMVTVGCGSDDRCELTATCPGNVDSGLLEGGPVLDEVVSDEGVSDDEADDASDDTSDDVSGPGPVPGGGADGGGASNNPGGSLTILPPGPPAPADCAAPDCPDGGAPFDPSDASATDTADGSIADCVGEGCDAGCQGDDCERGCIPGSFDSTNFDEACFQ